MAQNPELVAAPGQGSPSPAPFPRKGPKRSSRVTPSLQGMSRVTYPTPSLDPTCWARLQSQYCFWSCRGFDQDVPLRDADHGTTGLSEGNGGCTKSPFCARRVGNWCPHTAQKTLSLPALYFFIVLNTA